jgi:hypothetical protein
MPQQLFTWRREAQRARTGESGMVFAPVVLDTSGSRAGIPIAPTRCGSSSWTEIVIGGCDGSRSTRNRARGFAARFARGDGDRASPIVGRTASSAMAETDGLRERRIALDDQDIAFRNGGIEWARVATSSACQRFDVGRKLRRRNAHVRH